MKKNIDFFIIGTPKGGTTALGNFLSQAKGIFMPKNEITDFSSDRPTDRLPVEMSRRFSGVLSGDKIGAVDVTLLIFNDAIEHLHAHNPDMKLIAVLRNPVDRAYSAFWYARRFGWETEPTFEAALEKEEERAQGSRFQQGTRYLPHGEYSRLLATYFKQFGRSQVKVVFNEELKNNPEKTIIDLLTWLGVSPDISHMDLQKQSNLGGVPRHEWLNTLLLKFRLSKIPFIYDLIPPWFINRAFTMIKRPLIMINLRKDQGYPPILPETRKKLGMHFEPFNRELETLLDMDLSHWDNQ